nr:zinc finger, CCHC-type [Tanacetum cinerariifolium]
MTTSVVNNSVFKGFFEKQKLTGPNFIDWYRKLRIVLSVEENSDYLEQPIHPAPVPAQAGKQVASEALAAHTAWVKGSKDIVGLMLINMEPDIQRNVENLSAYDMLQELKTVFAQQAEHELLQTVKDFHSCKQEERHMGKTVNELHAMMKLHEQTLTKKDTALHETETMSFKLVCGQCAIIRGGIFETDLSNSNINDSSMYVVSKRIAKLNLDSALLWHCRLGHISKKRIEKLQHDGLLNSTDLRASEKCVSYMSGRMAQKPYTHQVERAKDLLRLIHTDEVENKLEKTIKSLRSDREGEYMIQKFLDHLKEHEIISHHAHPYTPKHNGVSERRNRTLLDIVRSMMSQTTLPKSFWDYALETVARILNMVPTKKVEKTPYERFHMENSKRGSIPMQEKLRLSKSQGDSTAAELKRMQNMPYASAVGYIMYDVRCTRPDVVFAQNITSRFQQNPGDLHWTPVKNILKYLRNTKDMFLVYKGDVDWKSTKQSIFATSSAEAEYIDAYDASKEAVWVRKFIFGLGVVPTIEELVNMYCDNTREITIVNESGITKGARHFHAKSQYLREVIEYGDISLEKVHTYDNLADPFTKALAFSKHAEHTRNIGKLPASSLM